MKRTDDEPVTVELEVEEARWLRSAALQGAGDSIVPGAAEQLRALADKIEATLEARR